MKTSTRTVGILLLLTIFSLVGKQVIAQDSGNRQKEEQARKEMELQEKKLQLERQKMEQEERMKRMEIEFAERAAEMEDMRERERTRVIVRSSGDEMNPVLWTSGNQSQLTLRNSFNGGSDNSKGEFEVNGDTRHVRCMINGKVRSGNIVIKVFYPDGKIFKELTINSSAEIYYNQSMNIKEGEEEKYTGTWKYEITASKAEGNYMLTIGTN
jgi:hypothetical protein